jgi:hypothetical protein
MRSDSNIFRWQDVACCPEHGAIYFAQVAEARNKTAGKAAVTNYSVDEEFDELFEEEFGDDEEELEIEQ